MTAADQPTHQPTERPELAFPMPGDAVPGAPPPLRGWPVPTIHTRDQPAVSTGGATGTDAHSSGAGPHRTVLLTVSVVGCALACGALLARGLMARGLMARGLERRGRRAAGAMTDQGGSHGSVSR